MAGTSTIEKADKKTSKNGNGSAKKEKAALQQGPTIIIRALPMKEIEVPIIGTSELVVSSWSGKAIREMLGRQVGKAKGVKKQRDARDPFNEYIESLYWLDLTGRSFGAPAAGFKNAMVSAAGRYAAGVKMTELRGLVFIKGETDPMGGPELVRIHGTPRMRMDMVRLQGIGRPADLRFRAGFPEWAATLVVRYNAELTDANSVFNLINLAGQTTGVCEWRPENRGSFGCFRVADDSDAKTIAKLQKDSSKATPVQDTEDVELKRLKIDDVVYGALNPDGPAEKPKKKTAKKK